ncbi:hypothetical protein KR074_006029, partial [Drosophila pseudoananassae]
VKAPSPKPPPESILITYYTSPVDFYYVTYQNAKASAHLVKNLEKELVQYCTPTKMQEKYARGQNVIVRYLAWTEPRMIRGQIMGQENEEYLVWITDYSFIICCVQADMWPLPEEMSRPIVEFHKGGVASITPYNGKEWLKSSRQLFGKLLENAIDLIYEVMYLDQSNNTKYGKLTIRSSSNEAAFDGATFLLDRKWASSPTKIIPMGRIENPVGFEVAEMNDQLTKPCQRVAKILKLVDDYALTIDPPATKSHLTKLVPDDEVDIGSNDVKAHSKPKILSRHEKNNQTQASLELMEEMLQCRNALLVPDTAKRFRRVNGQENPVGSGSCLTALRPKRVGANVDAISEEENDSPFNAPYNLSNVPTSVLLSQRSTSVDKPRRPLSTSTSYPQARPPRSTSVVQPMPIKSSSVSSRLITSESGTDVVSTTTGGTGVGQILSQKAKEIILGEHHSNDLTSLNHCVLAHSLKPATPIKELHKIPIYSGVKNEMHINSIYTPTPLQQYAWPHLCNGGSMILINSRATCRTWSYLPVICSTVKKAGFSAPTSPTSPGPLALLVTESPHSANTLFMQISNLMQNHDTHHPKIINGHNYSERELGILLLNSYSILVTTLSQLDTIIMDKPGVIDRNKLLFFVLDDFHTMQMKHPQIMDDLMQRLNDFRNPKTQIVIITQKWKSKPFKKLLKVMPDPLILFGNFLEAAMYGKLALSLSVQNEDQKFDKLLSFLGSHETLNKRTMIFFKTDKELIRHQKMLLDVGYKCIGILKAAEQVGYKYFVILTILINIGIFQQPYQLLLVSDQEGEVPLPIRNIETLIHYSFPLYWSKFAHRFHALADSIPNLAAPLTGNEKSITSVVMLGEKNQNELMRLVDFLRFHGITLSEEIAQLARACHEKNVGSRHICPYYLNNGNCHIFNCNKRHDYIREDMPDPGNPLLQPGTLIRCQLIKVYDPNHMSMWPLEFKAQGQDSWMDFGHHISHWTFSLEMSMGVRKVHNPYRLDDVCVVVRQGQVQRVRIVDIPPRRAVVVQQMDHGSELLHIKPSELLQCPEGKFTNQPAMALNIRLSGVEPASRNGQKWSEHSAKWTHEMLSNIGNNMHLQVIVDFTLHNVIYVKEITLVEECQFMRTSVYQFLLSKELVSRGFAKWVNKESGKTESKAVEEAKTQEVAEVEPNNNSPNSEDPTLNSNSEDAEVLEENQKDKQDIVPEDIECMNKDLSDNLSTDSEKCKLVSDNETDQLYKESLTIVKEDKNEKLEETNDSCLAFLKALQFEMETMSPSKKKETQDFLIGLLCEKEMKEPPKTKPVKALNFHGVPKKDSQEPSPEDVAASLQCGVIVNGSVNPKVKWHQDLSHIDLVIEQKVPEYKLILKNNSLVYMVSTTSPPQCCILNLLGEVAIESEKQIGYYLHIKLAKVGLIRLWPCLLSSFYAQQNAHWLTYNTELDKEPELSEAIIMWDSF